MGDLIRAGRIEEALAVIQLTYPKFSDENEESVFALNCQHFVELLRGVGKRWSWSIATHS